MLPGPQMLAGALTFQEQACLRAVRDRVALVPAGKLDSERHYSGGLVGSVADTMSTQIMRMSASGAMRRILGVNFHSMSLIGPFSAFHA